MSQHEKQNSRREFVKKAAYVTPIIITLAVAPSYAKSGSAKPGPQPKDPIPRQTIIDWLRRLLGL